MVFGLYFLTAFALNRTERDTILFGETVENDGYYQIMFKLIYHVHLIPTLIFDLVLFMIIRREKSVSIYKILVNSIWLMLAFQYFESILHSMMNWDASGRDRYFR